MQPDNTAAAELGIKACSMLVACNGQAHNAPLFLSAVFISNKGREHRGIPRAATVFAISTSRGRIQIQPVANTYGICKVCEGPGLGCSLAGNEVGLVSRWLAFLHRT